MWTLAIALTTGKNIRLFGVLDQNKTRFSTYVSQLVSRTFRMACETMSQRAESKAATVKTSD